MRWLKVAVGTFFLVAAFAAFFGVPFAALAMLVQAVPALLNRPLVAVPAFVVVTLVLGRIYCAAVCPLGILQGVVNWAFHPRTHVRRVCTRLPSGPVALVVRWAVALAFLAALFVPGLSVVVSQLDPYAIFGRAVTLSMPLGLVGMAVVAAAAFGKGRLWCNAICPLGTLFSFMARFALFGDKVEKGCVNCKACFAATPTTDAKGAPDRGGDGGGIGRREAMRGFAMLAAAEKITDGGLAEVTLPGVPAREHSVLPPGAVVREEFERKCVACQLCVANCPEKVLRPSVALKTLGQPEMDFRHGFCRLACTRCGSVCPSGAIAKLPRERRRDVHMGHAVWRKDLCIRTTEDVKCTACVKKCPVRAIVVVKGFPVVNRDKCIGCGACEHVCPSRPEPAIAVTGFDVQRVTLPVAEGIAGTVYGASGATANGELYA